MELAAAQEQIRIMMEASDAAWAQYSLIKLGSQTFSFTNHEYQFEPMNEHHQKVCYMKGTGGGFSQLEILKTIRGCIKKRFPQGALYLFPTGDDVSEYSKSRFGPLLADNPVTIGKYVQNTDMATLKKIGDSWLYLRGARLSQTVGSEGQKESSRLAGIQVDRVVFDEPDKMDMEAIGKARGRFGHSLVKEEVWISNPTAENFGVDIPWKLSDQRHWHRKCQSCGTYTCAEEEFPNCVERGSDGKGYIACKKCGKPLPIFAPGTQWVAKYPERSGDWVGYRWSHLTSVYNDPADVLDNFINPPEGNLGDVYRLRLGLPYSSKEDMLEKRDILACCGSDLPSTSSIDSCAMGVDVGKTFHVVIGKRIGDERYMVLFTGKVAGWNELHDLAIRFKIRSACIDLRPYEDGARQFRKAHNFETRLCEYSDSLLSETIYNQSTGVVRVHRTGVCDQTHRLFMTQNIILPRQCPQIEEYAQQCVNIVRFQELDKRTKTPIYRYRTTPNQPDHFRHATNYFLIAARRLSKSTVSGSRQVRPNRMNNEYVRV